LLFVGRQFCKMAWRRIRTQRTSQSW